MSKNPNESNNSLKSYAKKCWTKVHFNIFYKTIYKLTITTNYVLLIKQKYFRSFASKWTVFLSIHRKEIQRIFHFKLIGPCILFRTVQIRSSELFSQEYFEGTKPSKILNWFENEDRIVVTEILEIHLWWPNLKQNQRQVDLWVFPSSFSKLAMRSMLN